MRVYRFSDGPPIHDPVEVQKVKYRYKMNTVRIPLIYCYEFGRQKWQRNSWQIFGGVHIGWNVRSTYTREWYSNGSVPQGWDESVNIIQFLQRNWFLGGSYGVAFKFDLDPKASLRFEYRTVFGRPYFKIDFEHTRDERAVVRLNDTYDPSRYYGQVRFPTGYHQLSVGYVFVRTPYRLKSFF